MDKEKFLAHIKSHEVTSCSELAAFTDLTVKSRNDICLLLNALKKKAKHNSKDLNDIPIDRNNMIHCLDVLEDIVVSIGHAAMAEGYHAYKDL